MPSPAEEVARLFMQTEEDDEQDEMPHDPLPDLFRPLPVGLTKRRVPSRYS